MYIKISKNTTKRNYETQKHDNEKPLAYVANYNKTT